MGCRYKSHLASNAEDSPGKRSIHDVLDALCFCSNLIPFSSTLILRDQQCSNAQDSSAFRTRALANQPVTAALELDDVFDFFSSPTKASSLKPVLMCGCWIWRGVCMERKEWRYGISILRLRQITDVFLSAFERGRRYLRCVYYH